MKRFLMRKVTLGFVVYGFFVFAWGFVVGKGQKTKVEIVYVDREVTMAAPQPKDVPVVEISATEARAESGGTKGSVSLETYKVKEKEVPTNMALVRKDQQLAMLGTPDSVIELIGMLGRASTDEEQRNILSMAWQINNPETSGLLLETLSATYDADIQVLAQRALANMADEPLFYEITERYYESSDGWEKENLLGVVRQMENKGLVPALIEILDESDLEQPDSMTKVLVCTLADMGTPESVDYLNSILPYLDEETGHYVAITLASL